MKKRAIHHKKIEGSASGDIIVVKDLERTYPGEVPTLALRGVSFTIAQGEFVAIMGRSGSGKSTLLHQLSLLDTPTGGWAYIGDTDILALSDAARTRFRLERLGYIFQEYALIAEFTALENVFLPAMVRGQSSACYRSRAKDLLSTVGLAERLDHYPHELSGGEQQRVAIARALINEPEVLFADEPCANLDTASSETVMRLFQELKHKLGQTIVMVTHEPDDTEYVDRVIRLSDGLIERIDTEHRQMRRV